MPGIDTGAPDLTETNSGASPSPRLLARRPLERCEMRIDRCIKFGRPARGEEPPAQGRAEHKARRHRNAKAAHLDETCSLAAEQLTKLSRIKRRRVVQVMDRHRSA